MTTHLPLNLSTSPRPATQIRNRPMDRRSDVRKREVDMSRASPVLPAFQAVRPNGMKPRQSGCVPGMVGASNKQPYDANCNISNPDCFPLIVPGGYPFQNPLFPPQLALRHPLFALSQSIRPTFPLAAPESAVAQVNCVPDVCWQLLQCNRVNSAIKRQLAAQQEQRRMKTSRPRDSIQKHQPAGEQAGQHPGESGGISGK